MKEYILCAAIHYPNNLSSDILSYQPKNISTGFVVCGHRHHQIIQLCSHVMDYRLEEKDIEGFLTSKNRFVTRNEAFNIAHNAGQIRGAMFDRDELYSKDLY